MLVRCTAVAILVVACRGDGGRATPAGAKLIEWKRGPTSYSTGVSLGDDMGPPIVEDKTLLFTPKDPRNDDLGPVRLSLHVERGEVRVIPNSQGERPAEQAAAPRKLEVTLLANAGWEVNGACDAALLPLSSLGSRRVGVAQRCTVNLKSGDDTGAIHLTVRGDGHVDTVGSFGSVELP